MEQGQIGQISIDKRRIAQAKELAKSHGLKTISSFVERVISREYRDAFPDSVPPGLDLTKISAFRDPQSGKKGPWLHIRWTSLPPHTLLQVNLASAREIANALERHSSQSGLSVEKVFEDGETSLSVGRRGNGLFVLIADTEAGQPRCLLAKMTPTLADDYAKAIHLAVDELTGNDIDNAPANDEDNPVVIEDN